MEKTSRVVKCTYDKPWKAPNGDTIHWHFVELEDGTTGKCGTSEISPPKIAVGTEITYMQEAPGKNVKLIGFKIGGSGGPKKSHHKAPTTQNPTKEATPKPAWQKQTSRKNPEDYLGFVFGYAKDITIALINNGDKKAKADPVGVTNKMSEEFYTKVKQLLN